MWHQPGTWRLLGSQDPTLGSFSRRVHPAWAHNPRQGTALARRSAQWGGWAQLPGLPGFQTAPLGATWRVRSFCFRWGVGRRGPEGQKMSLCTSLRPSGPLPGGSHWKEPTQPRALLGRPEYPPSRALERVSREVGALD